MELKGHVKTYEWGKLGCSSEVAKLAKLNAGQSFDVDNSKPYSELWMGDHPSGSATLKTSGAALRDVLKENSNLLQSVSSRKPLDGLPYLLKVLSINTALSIQVKFVNCA